MVFQRGSVSYGGIEHAVVLYNIWLDASFTYKEYNFLSCFLDFVLTFSLYALFTLINNVFPLIRRQKQLHKVGDRQGNLLGGVSGGGGGLWDISKRGEIGNDDKFKDINTFLESYRKLTSRDYISVYILEYHPPSFYPIPRVQSYVFKYFKLKLD